MTAPALTVVSTVEHAAGITTQLLGFAAMAAVLSWLVALVYRSFADEVIPRWLAVLAGASGVAIYLGTTPALEAVVREGIDPGEIETALFNVTALLSGVGGALAGRQVGDRFGSDVFGWSPTQDADEEVNRLAQTVGQVTTVSLPTEIEDASGYDPIPERTKESLEGKKFVFPRGLTVEELEERLGKRLRSDYGIGTIDVEFDGAGSVSYLAVGMRAAGIGSTLPPATNAVAVRADPGFSASTGDIVQVWDPDSMQRLLTGELRGAADDVVTIAIDAGDTPKVDPTRRYRLVTLPVEDRPDREFASLLRAAEETFSTVTVEAGSPLHGLPVGALDPTVTAIRPEAGDPVPFPDGEYRLAPGDMLFIVARPAALRRLETAAEPLDPAVVSEAEPSLPADRTDPPKGIQTAESTTTREESTGEDGTPETDTPENSAEESDPAEGIVTGKADGASFNEIKAEFESSDDGGEAGADETEPVEAGGEDDETTGTQTFDELKAEFESGEADWSDEQPRESDGSETTDDDTEATDEEMAMAGDTDISFGSDDSEQGDDEGTDGDELVGLEEADISFGDDTDEDGDETAEGESADESLGDDIGSLDFEEDDSEDIGDLELGEEDGLFSDEEDDEGTSSDEDDEDGTDDDGSESGTGGGKSFAELKEEFESGDADWEDDVSDSPGGDMRLDE